MTLHKPKALHRFSERGLEGRERASAGERTNAEGGCEAHACMLHIGVCSTRLRAKWVRNGRGGNWIWRSCGAKIRFGARATGKLASNACVKPATTCKQLHEMSVAASPVGDVDA